MDTEIVTIIKNAFSDSSESKRERGNMNQMGCELTTATNDPENMRGIFHM